MRLEPRKLGCAEPLSLADGRDTPLGWAAVDGFESAIADEPTDLSVVLADAKGVSVRIALSDVMPLPLPIGIRLTRLGSIEAASSEPILQTFVIPLSALAAANASFDAALLRSVALEFDRSPRGVVIVDDVGLRAR